MPQPISSDCRQIISNIIRYCHREKTEKKEIIPLNKINLRAATMCGKSVKTIKRIRKEAYMPEQQPSTSNQSLINKSPSKIILANIDICAIRHTIRRFYTERKETPTLQNLLPVLVAANKFSGNKAKLKNVLHRIGFAYRKNPRKGRLLLERSMVVVARTNYLNKVRDNLASKKPKPLIYIYQGTLATRSVNIDEVEHKTRWRILIAVNNKGLLKDGLHIHKLKGKSSDIFMNWFKNSILNSLKGSHMICIENAVINQTILDKKPGFFDSKESMQVWLEKYNIPFEDTLYKSELLALIEKAKVVPSYKFEEDCNAFGHVVAVIPDRHGDLNPISDVWKSIKGKLILDENQDAHTLSSVISALLKENGLDVWKAQFDACLKLVDKYYNDEIIIDEFTD